MIPFIDLAAQQARIKDHIDAAIAGVLSHGQYIMGPEVADLEAALSDYCGAKHAITCGNGTDALVLVLMAYDIGPGDAVFAPSFTFVSTVEAVKLRGATPVFVDVQSDTFNLCPTSLSEAIDFVKSEGKLKPRAIIPVDLFGQTADYRLINAIAQTESLHVIADGAQSFGATLDGKKVGCLADVTTTSFFPAKPLGCYGDGGALFTDDDALAKRLRSYRNHGQGTDRYDNIRVGLNSRLDTIQAAVLIEKLKAFPQEVELRRSVAKRYIEALPNSWQPQSLVSGASSVWAQFTIFGDGRDYARSALSEKGVPTAVYYPRPNHLQAPYLDSPTAPNGLPVTEYLQDRVFSLPMHPYLEDSDQDRVLSALNDLHEGA